MQATLSLTRTRMHMTAAPLLTLCDVVSYKHVCGTSCSEKRSDRGVDLVSRRQSARFSGY